LRVSLRGRAIEGLDVQACPCKIVAVAAETLTPEARRALIAGRLGHLVTINPDGSPQASCVWIGLDGNDIVAGHMMRGRKVTNIARDPRVVLTVEAEGANPLGMTNYLIVHGTARLVEGGAPELLQRLAEVYLGPGVRFPPFDNPPPGHVIRITADRIGGVGPWVG
jgi:PPOX class probable F420-dependent enzyme